MPTSDRDLTSYEYGKLRAQILAESDICIVCGHTGSKAVDHIHPRAMGGVTMDPDNLAPIHGVELCPICLRNCNNEKGTKPLSAVLVIKNSVDWFAGPASG